MADRLPDSPVDLSDQEREIIAQYRETLARTWPPVQVIFVAVPITEEVLAGLDLAEVTNAAAEGAMRGISALLARVLP